MLREIAALLTTAKGAAAATLIAGSTVTGGAVVTMPEVQTAVVERANTVTATLGSAVAAVAKAAKERRDAATSCGKPEVVSQRNEADKQLRDAFHEDHQALVALKAGKDTDHQKLNAAVKDAQAELRSILTAALVDVSRETQGRTGQVARANGAAAAAASASPTPVTFSEALTTTSTAPVGACDESAGTKEDVTLNATLQAIVDQAVLDMDAVIETAETDAGAVPPAERGKPSEDAERTTGKDKKDGEPKKSGEPKGNKPSTPPGRTR